MKVYVSRDQGDNWIWVWLGPEKPKLMSNVDRMKIFTRSTLDETCHAYTVDDFKTKFNKTVKRSTCVKMDLPDKLVLNEDYKLFSKDIKRKR